MKLLNAVTALSLLFCFQSFAQQIDYELVENLFLANNLELKQTYEKYQKKISTLDDYSLIDNPAIKYGREQISGVNPEDIEQVFLVEQKVDLLLQPFLKFSVVSRETDAMKLIYERDSIGIVTDFKMRFNEIVLVRNIYELYKTTSEVVTKAFEAARERYLEGNVSGFELKRFSAAKSTIIRELNLRENVYYEKLGNLLSDIYNGEELKNYYSSGLESIEILGDLSCGMTTWELSELMQIAIHNRRDLKAIKILKETGEDRLTIEELNRLPGLTFEGGYKKVSGLGDGYVLGVSLEIPLFNFNGNEIDKASAESNIINYELLKKEKYVLLETASLYNKITALGEQLNEFEKDKLEISILETATLLYSEGEISLVELLDAVNAYIEISNLYLTSKCEYKNLITETNKVLGINLTGK